MKMNETSRNFKMSYSALMQLGDKSVMLIDRDATELEKYGVRETQRAAVIEKTQLLKNLPTDEELLSKVSISTEEKNKSADIIQIAIRSITVRAKNLFGENSPKYKQFGVKGLDRMNDNDLYRCAKRVVRISTEILPELSEKGLTEAEISDLENKAQGFDDKIDIKEKAVTDRDIATAERIKLSNELYKLVNEVFDYGKSHWYSRNEAKYNDYIIYDHPSSGKKGDTIAPSMETTIASDENITAETVFEIENTGKVSIMFYVSESTDAEMPTNALTLEAGQTGITKVETISDGTYGLLLVLNASNADGAFLLGRVE